MTSKTVQVIENLLETPWTPQFLFPPKANNDLDILLPESQQEGKANNDLDILLPESQQEDICYILQKNWLAPKLSSTIYTFDKIYNLKTEQYFRNAVKEAAIQSGFALHVRDSRSRDNCLYVLFSCVCSRVSEPTNNVKKTTTKAAVDKERTCPFSFRVRVTTEAIELLPATSRNEWVHCFHRELEGALVRRPMSLLTDENKKMLNNLEISCITPSTMAHILTNKTGLVWSRKQLEIVNKVEKLNTDSSPAEELLSYLSSLKNVSYFIITDEMDSHLISYIGKGRPKKEKAVNSPGNIVEPTQLSASEDFACDFRHRTTKKTEQMTKDIRSLRAALHLRSRDSLMLCCGWITDEQKQIFAAFPEALSCDTTSKTNNEGRELFLVCLKDSYGNTQIVLQVFMPSQKTWVYEYIFSQIIPSLVGVDVVKRNKIIVTDGETEMFYHLLYFLIDRCETEEEYNLMVHYINQYVVERQTIIPKAAFTAFRVFLTKLIADRKLCARFNRNFVKCYGISTTNYCEQQNRVLKRCDNMTVKAGHNICTAARTINARLDYRAKTNLSKRTQGLQLRSYSSTVIADSASNTSIESHILDELTPYACELLKSEWDRRKLYDCAYDSGLNMFLLRYRRKTVVQSNSGDEDDTDVPKLDHVRRVVCNGNHIICSCGLWQNMSIPCAHIFCITNECTTEMIHVRWFKVYGLYYGKGDSPYTKAFEDDLKLYSDALGPVVADSLISDLKGNESCPGMFLLNNTSYEQYLDMKRIYDNGPVLITTNEHQPAKESKRPIMHLSGKSTSTSEANDKESVNATNTKEISNDGKRTSTAEANDKESNNATNTKEISNDGKHSEDMDPSKSSDSFEEISDDEMESVNATNTKEISNDGKRTSTSEANDKESNNATNTKEISNDGNHSEDMDPSKSSDSFDSFEEISDDEMNELQPHTLSVLSQVTNENKNIGRHKKINECENYNYFHSEMKNMLSMAERHPECLEFIKNGFRDMKAGIIKQILTKRSRNSSQITTETEEVSRLVSSQVEMKYRSDYKGKRFKNIFET